MGEGEAGVKAPIFLRTLIISWTWATATECFKTHLGDTCLTVFVRVSQGQSDSLYLVILGYVSKLKLVLFAKPKGFRREGFSLNER